MTRILISGSRFILGLVAASLLCILTMAPGCKPKNSNSVPPDPPPPIMADAPDFDQDSAYAFVARQVAFGPRVPNHPGHVACGDWIIAELKASADTVYVQEAGLRAYDGTILKSRNIIASFNPSSDTRILLCAHWDTRPFADQDDERKDEPIAGANDGASGVGVLMEVARQIKGGSIGIGVDIVLFDSEDYGQPDGVRPFKSDTYCLGSQYWSRRPHVKGYRARFGILLDMVGARNSRFTREGTSMYFAGTTMTRVWDVANKLGFGQYFVYDQSGQVTDDHLYVNRITGIPTIDIIHREAGDGHGFGPYWHTHDDNMDIIDPVVLDAVGQTVLQVIYNYDAAQRIL